METVLIQPECAQWVAHHSWFVFSREVNGWAGVLLCFTSGPMAHSVRRDAPELPDFSLLKRLARDQLIYLLEQVGLLHLSIVLVLSIHKYSHKSWILLKL